jgi:UDP-N-acetylenolpyruvoylglucosamine reductase
MLRTPSIFSSQGDAASELLALSDEVRTAVRTRFGVELEREPALRE